MFRNYLIIALRNLARHKLYSFINIAGLAVGLTAVIFVILFVRDELSYDSWIADTQNIYRLEITAMIPGRPPLAIAVTPFGLPQAMRDELPGVTGMTRIISDSKTLTAGDRQFSQDLVSVDPDFFNMIRLPLAAGDPATVFRQPQSLVLSQSLARKYFGDANPIGRTLTTTRSDCAATDAACHAQVISLKVTGVLRDIPHNSQFQGDAFIPNTSIADTLSQETKHEWMNQDGWGYVRLAPGANPDAVAANTTPLLDRNMAPGMRQMGIPAGPGRFIVHLTPFAQVHLASSRWLYNMTPAGSWTTVYGVIGIGVLILLVACFNFMNLATARAMLRAREIALRKTLGARRRQLVVQFLGEAVLMALLALVLAFAMAEMLLPVFDNFLGHPLGLNYAADWPLLLALVGMAVAAGLISGSYPALILSGFRPAATLRTNSSGQAGSSSLRSILVVLQFAVSIGLGIAAAVVFSQINYARNMELGFRRDNIVVLRSAYSLAPEQRRAFEQALRANPGVMAVGMSDRAPFDGGQSNTAVQVPGQPDEIVMNWTAADPHYPEIYGIKLVAGRMLSDTRGADRIHSMVPGLDPLNEGRNIVINAAAAHRLGFAPDQAVGQVILFNHNRVRIVGVLADAKIQGARAPVVPMLYPYVFDHPMEIAVRLRPDMIPQTVAFIDRTWRAFSPTVAMWRSFLADDFGKFYQADQRQGAMFAVFVGIAIFIASLGLFGLAAFTAGRRTREIGIRKVFGARSRDVIFLLLWQFSIPVLVANAIAWPLAWYYLHSWLQGFAYHIALSPLYFLAAGAVAMVIAWATVFAHARRVAGANPIHALRYE